VTYPLGILLIREAHASDAARLADDVDVIPCCRGEEDSLSAASEWTGQGGDSWLLWWMLVKSVLQHKVEAMWVREREKERAVGEGEGKGRDQGGRGGCCWKEVFNGWRMVCRKEVFNGRRRLLLFPPWCSKRW
jgi:hypothetical protein